jgi:hypothetical protein
VRGVGGSAVATLGTTAAGFLPPFFFLAIPDEQVLVSAHVFTHCIPLA